MTLAYRLPTKLIDVFLVLAHFFCEGDNKYVVVLTGRCPAFGEEDHFLARDLVVPDGFADDLLRLAI